MDNLSLILTVFEILIGAAVAASVFIALGKLYFYSKKLSNGLKIVSTYIVSDMFFAEYLINALFDEMVEFFAKTEHLICFSLRYIHFSLLEEYCSIKQDLKQYKNKTQVFIHDNLLNRGSPNIRVVSRDTLSSQSFIKISPIIMQ